MRHINTILGFFRKRDNERKTIYKIEDPFFDEWNRIPYYFDRDVIIYSYEKTFADGTQVRVYANRKDYDRQVWRIDARFGVFGYSNMVTNEFARNRQMHRIISATLLELHHAREY